MKKSKILLVLIGGLIVGIAAIPIAITLIGSATKLTTPQASATELIEDERRGVSAEVARVKMGPIETVIGYPGSVRPVAAVEVIPQVSGRIEKMNVDVGDSVEAGEVLAVIESDALNAQVQQAQAALKVAGIQIEQMRGGGRREQIAKEQAAVDAAQARLDRARLPLNENEQAMAKTAAVQARAALKLAQAAYDDIAWFDGKGMLPQSLGLEQATAAHEAANAQYEEAMAGAKPEDIRVAQAMVDQATAQLDLAKNPYRDTDLALAAAQYLQAKAAADLMAMQLSEANVKAPMSGTISESPQAVGATVELRKSMFTIVCDEVEIIVKVEEARIGQIQKGQPTAVNVSAYPDRTFTGEVSLISPTANASDRTFEVRISPDEQDNMLRGGMFAEVNLVTEQYANALLVPTSAVVTEGDQTYVFVVNNDQVEKQEVTTGLTKKDVTQIKSGLVLGEQVVVFVK